MNWLETLLGMFPDNGDGSFEAILLLAIVAMCALRVALHDRAAGRNV